MDQRMRRTDMVDGLCHETRGVLEDPTVADAMWRVPRHEFVTDEERAYADVAHDEQGTTTLAPNMVATLIEALDVAADSNVLIVGAGVGYTAAVCAAIVGERRVNAVDISRPLVETARLNLASAGYEGVLVNHRDGATGLAAYAPFDRILIEAAVTDPPAQLQRQLADGGRLVAPVGTSSQQLMAFDADGPSEQLTPVSFRPLLVDGEQHGALERNRNRRETNEMREQRGPGQGWEREWIEWDQ